MKLRFIKSHFLYIKELHKINLTIGNVASILELYFRVKEILKSKGVMLL